MVNLDKLSKSELSFLIIEEARHLANNRVKSIVHLVTLVEKYDAAEREEHRQNRLEKEIVTDTRDNQKNDRLHNKNKSHNKERSRH